MKKLILIFGAFLIICVIVTHIAGQQAQGKTHETETQSVSEQQKSESYTIKSENGRIVVYQGEELLYKTNTATSTLPKIDQKELLYGIVVSSKQEVEKVLQDYCS